MIDFLSHKCSIFYNYLHAYSIFPIFCYLCAGVSELRLLQMGPAEYLTTLTTELKLVHDFEHVLAVYMKDLVSLDGVSPEVKKIVI